MYLYLSSKQEMTYLLIHHFCGFQIKLHQVAPLEGPSNGDLDVIRPDNPTPPETPHFLPSYSNDCSSKNIPVAALAIEEDEFDDAQEALYDSRVNSVYIFYFEACNFY